MGEVRSAILDEIEGATIIETRNIAEIEKELISIVPVKPEMCSRYAMIFDDCKKGHEYFHQQDYDNAIQHYQAAIDCQNNDEISFCLALSYYLKGDYTNASKVANAFKGKVLEVEFLGSSRYGMNPFILDTRLIDQLYYLLEKRLA